jgi:hypothetical protein
MLHSALRGALAGAFLAGSSLTAQASLLIVISDLTGVVTTNRCDTATAQSATNCVGYAPYAVGTNTVLFSGSVGDFTFSNSIFSTNAPGTGGPLGSAFASTTNLNIFSLTAAQTLKIDFTGFGFTQPAGSSKTITGTSSQNGYASSGASTQSYGFYIDGANSGAQTQGVTCGPTPLLIAAGGCTTSGVVNGIGAVFSLSDVATYFVAQANGDFQASSTVTATAATASVPEPGSLALVGIAAAAFAVVRRRTRHLQG